MPPLNAHRNIVTDKIRYECPNCGKCFDTIKGLRTHLRQHCKNKPKPQWSKGTLEEWPHA